MKLLCYEFMEMMSQQAQQQQQQQSGGGGALLGEAAPSLDSKPAQRLLLPVLREHAPQLAGIMSIKLELVSRVGCRGGVWGGGRATCSRRQLPYAVKEGCSRAVAAVAARRSWTRGVRRSQRGAGGTLARRAAAATLGRARASWT